jgi:hypothetical protein
MRIQLRYFLAPKRGCTPEECEDALGLNLDARSFAIADGATEAFASGQWAKHLAHKWALSDMRPLEPFDFRAWVAAQGQIWHEQWQEKKLPWYAEAKERDGSFATFVGLKLDTGYKMRWRAIALGDACFFHRHGATTIKTLPLKDRRQFSATPQLVASRPEKHEKAFEKTVVASDEIRAGDVLWLASDAIAAWLWRAWDNEELQPLAEKLETLLRDKSYEELTQLVEQQRQAGQLRDDDIALVRIAIMESGE